MRLLVVGSGAREHALVWRLAREGHTLWAAPGNPGIAAVATCLTIAADDVEGQVGAACDHAVDLVVVGPEAPLCAGLADAVRTAGVACFGPGRDGARLEGSKVWSKELFARHRLPTAEFAVCASRADVDAALGRLGEDVVVKADGLAAGKGVVVARAPGEARAAALRMLEERQFGAAGERVVIERRLRGREISILAITDGARAALLEPAEDHKPVFDGDRGPMTGGMGVVSPSPVVTPEILSRVRGEVIDPTVVALRAEGIDYRGVLYAGLMIDAEGRPFLLEYNCRFGDPETEPLMARWDDDLAGWLAGAASGRLPPGEPRFSAQAAVCVVLAAAGYPDKPRTGDVIAGVEEAAALPDVLVFHAGTRRRDGELVTAGGRVLAVTALGEDVSAARARAYRAAGRISWDGVHYRRDIGARGKEAP